jgi:mannose-6-phosphate isomerase-like protein (cupin superfamily)
MAAHDVGAAVVEEQNGMVGIVSERDILRAVAGGRDLDVTRVDEVMTRDVVTVGPDWEVYEATAEMADHHIRHLVVRNGGDVLGILSVRDVLLAGQRVELTDGHWVVLRDPLTFTIRERRRLQRYLLILRGQAPAEFELAGLIGLLVGSWSFDLALPAEPEGLRSIPAADYELVRAAVLAELPDLQRSVHPSPGWRRR